MKLAIIAVAVAAFAPLPAVAHSLWWQRVTAYEDGRALDVSELLMYRLEWNDGGDDFATPEGQRDVAAASVTVPDPVGLLRCYRVFAVIVVSPTERLVSPPSNVWCKDMRPVAPPPPPPPAPTRVPAAPVGLSGN